jgi:hypothetical protein
VWLRAVRRMRKEAKPVAVASSLALLGIGALHTDALMRTPHANRFDVRVVDPLHSDVNRLAASRRAGQPDVFPFTSTSSSPRSRLDS